MSFTIYGDGNPCINISVTGYIITLKIFRIVTTALQYKLQTTIYKPFGKTYKEQPNPLGYAYLNQGRKSIYRRQVGRCTYPHRKGQDQENLKKKAAC